MIGKFNPAMMPQDAIVETFVGRQDLVRGLMSAIKAFADGKATSHFLLIGPRGIGKTHLLLFVERALADDPCLSKRVLAIRLAEEEYGCTCFNDLLERLAAAAGGSLQPGERAADGNHMEGSRAAAGEALLDIIRAKSKKKKIVLLIDNLDMLFEQFQDEHEEAKLREMLSSSKDYLLVATAVDVSTAITDAERPLFGFFELKILGELSDEEFFELVRKRLCGERKEQVFSSFPQVQARIAALAELAGRNPRLGVVLSELLVEKGAFEVVECCKRILDDLTPYFKARYESLAPQQRKILEALSVQKSPTTPAHVAEETGIAHDVVCTQLRRLVDSRHVKQADIRKGRNAYYEVAEPLYRMWRRMRSARNEEERLEPFAWFLEDFYPLLELVGQMKELTAECAKQTSSGAKSRATRILDFLTPMAELLDEPLTQIGAALENLRAGRLNAAEKLLAKVGRSASRSGNKDIKAGFLLTRALIALCKGRSENAIADIENAKSLVGRNPGIFSMLALHSLETKKYDNALEYIDEAIAGYQHQKDPHEAQCRYFRGLILEAAGRKEEALREFKDSAGPTPSPETLTKIARLLGDLNRPKEAVEAWASVVAATPDKPEAQFNYGFSLHKAGRKEEAAKAFSMASELDPNSATYALWEGIGRQNAGAPLEAARIFARVFRLATEKEDPETAKAAAQWYWLALSAAPPPTDLAVLTAVLTASMTELGLALNKGGNEALRTWAEAGKAAIVGQEEARGLLDEMSTLAKNDCRGADGSSTRTRRKLAVRFFARMVRMLSKLRCVGALSALLEALPQDIRSAMAEDGHGIDDSLLRALKAVVAFEETGSREHVELLGAEERKIAKRILATMGASVKEREGK